MVQQMPFMSTRPSFLMVLVALLTLEIRFRIKMHGAYQSAFGVTELTRPGIPLFCGRRRKTAYCSTCRNDRARLYCPTKLSGRLRPLW